MTFGGHVRMAGTITVIVAFFLQNMTVTAFGLMLIAIGAIWQIDGLEQRMAELEKKGADDEEA